MIRNYIPKKVLLPNLTEQIKLSKKNTTFEEYKKYKSQKYKKGISTNTYNYDMSELLMRDLIQNSNWRSISGKY